MTTNNLPILYSFRRCPYAMRARVALASAGITVELREIVLRNKPESMLVISPKGTVPVLQLTDGQVIDESINVMVWALQQNDPEQWLNVQPELTAKLIDQNDHSFKGWLDRYKYFERHPEKSQLSYRQEAEKYLAEWEGLLAQHEGKGLVADRITWADMALRPFVRQFARCDWDWFLTSPYPLLRQWLIEFEAGEHFQRVMKKYRPWQSDDEPLLLDWS